VEKSGRFLREFSLSLRESALSADFPREDIFHRSWTLFPKIHPFNPRSVAAAAQLGAGAMTARGSSYRVSPIRMPPESTVSRCIQGHEASKHLLFRPLRDRTGAP